MRFVCDSAAGWLRAQTSLCVSWTYHLSNWRFYGGNGAFFRSKKGRFQRFRTTFSMNVAQVLYLVASPPRGPCDRKKFNPDRKFQSWLEIVNPGSKISISIENFNPAVFPFPRPSWCYREGLDRKCQSTIDRSKFSIPKAAITFFNPRGCKDANLANGTHVTHIRNPPPPSTFPQN